MAYLGNRPVSGDNNSFRVLDDIKTHTFSFDGSSSSVVSTSDNTITHKGHRLIQGQRVTYTDGTGSPIGGLTDGTVYFVVINDANSFKLASSASNAAAGTGINLSGLGSGTAHNITVAFDGVNTKFKATFNNGTEADVTRVAQIQISLNNVIQQPQNTATPTSGFGFDSDSVIVFATAPASNVTFWGVLFANNFPTFEISDNDVDSFTGNGSTTEFSLSKSPATNENIIVTIDGVVQYPSDNSTTRAYNTVGNALQFSAAPADGADIQARHIGFAGPDPSVAGVTAFYGRTGSVFLNNSDNIVVNDAEVTGNLTVQGDTTTLNTTLRNVELLRVDGNDTVAAGIITQRGSGDILKLYDTSSPVFVVKDGGRVGIGTDNPNVELDIEGASARIHLHDRDSNQAQILQSGNALYLNVDSEGNGGGSFRMRVGGTTSEQEVLRVGNAGNVGIGTATVDAKLHVEGDIKASGIVTASSFVGGLPITNGADNRVITATSASAIQGEAGLRFDGTTLINAGSGFKEIAVSCSTNNSATLRLQNNQKNFAISNVTGGKIAISDGNTQRFIIDGSGNVGVGTNSISTRFEIEGTAALTNHNQTLLIRDSVSDDATGRGGNIGFGAYVQGTMRTLAAIGALKKNSGTGFDGNLAFYTRRNGIGPVDERMRIHSEGIVEIMGQDDQNNFEINVNSSQFAVHTDDTDGEISLRAQDGAGGTNSKYMTFFTQATGQSAIERLRITESGEIRIANGGLLTIKTDAAATYGVSEAFRVDDNNSTGDRALQIFEYQNAGARWHSFNQNLHVTTTGTSYTYTQGNYGGSNMIEMTNGDLRIYSDPSIVGGGTSAITPTQTVSILNNGNVGIGTDSPDQELHVVGQIKVDDSNYARVEYARNDTNLWSVGLRDTDDFWIFRESGAANVIFQHGNVGIGTDDPKEALHVKSGTGSGFNSTYNGRTAAIIEGDSVSGTVLSIMAKSSGYSGLFFGDESAEASGQIQYIHSTNSFKFNTSGGTANLVLDGGNVGIGTISPNAVLHVEKNGSNQVLARFESNMGTNNSRSLALTSPTSDSSSLPFTFSTGNSISFKCDTHVVHIDTDGRLGIGTDAPTQLIDVYKTSNDALIKTRTTGAGAYFEADSAVSGFHGISLSSGGTEKWFLGSYNSANFTIKDGQRNNGTEIFTILDTSGKVGIGSDNPHRTLVLETGDGDIHCLDGNGGIYMGTDNSGGFQKNCAIARAGANNYHISGSTPGDLCIAGESGQSMIFGVSPFAGGMDTFLHVSRLRNFNLYGTDYKFHIGSTERFNIKNNGNIGIGTDNATSKVHIGPQNGDTRHHVYLSSGNNDYGFLIDVQDYGNQNVPLRIFNRLNNTDTEVVRITQDGNVGIGTNNPITKLHVESATGTTTYATISQQKTYGSGTGTAERSGLNLAIREANSAANNRIFGRIEVGTNSETDSSHGFMSFFTRQSATISEKLRITSTGNVGINETSPASTLVVRKDNQGGRGGEISIVNYAGGGSNGIGNEAALNFGLENSTYDADSGNAQIKAVTTAATNGTDIVISNWSGSSFEERLRIRNDGKVGINVTDPDSIFETVSPATDGINAHIGGLYNDGGQLAVRRIEFGVKNYRNAIQSQQGSGGNNFSSDNDLLLNPSGGKVGIGTNGPGTTLDVFGFLQVKDSTGKLSMQVDGANGTFKVFQSPAGWTNLTYNPNPILAWDFKSGPGDLMYMASGGNTPTADQMALVISDNHGFKVGKSGYDNNDFDVSSSDEFFRVDTSGNLTLTGKTGNSNPRFTIRHNNADVEGEVIRFARTELPGIRYHSIKARHSGNSSLNYISVNVHDGGGSPYTGQTEVARFLGSGKVGVGTDIPSDGAKLEVFARGDTERGIFITDSNTTHNSPYLRVLGKRSDGNTHQSFSGRILLASLRTDAKVNSGRKVGVIMFGGNHTNTSESNILYAASIAGIAGDSFDSATDMHTDLAFYTGNTGRAPNTNNVSSGEERLRIKSTGVVTMPYQVAFFAHSTIGNHDLDAGDKFQFNSIPSSGNVSVNSNHTTFGGTNVFDTSTNTFTAPVAGLYQFTVTAYYRRTGDPLGPLVPRVNNGEVSNGNNNVMFFGNSNPTDGDTMSGTLYLQLAAGDEVTVHRRNHGSGTVRFYGPHSHFCGHLIG